MRSLFSPAIAVLIWAGAPQAQADHAVGDAYVLDRCMAFAQEFPALLETVKLADNALINATLNRLERQRAFLAVAAGRNVKAEVGAGTNVGSVVSVMDAARGCTIVGRPCDYPELFRRYGRYDVSLQNRCILDYEGK